jgi:glucose-1-phosphate cytidylyltransferase
MGSTGGLRVVVLAGGFGSRLAEETDAIPKPMVTIGGRPILWHILKHYAQHGFREFAIALGYKGDAIQRWFVEYATSGPAMTVHVGSGRVDHHERPKDDWTVHLVDTGLETLTGGRVRRLGKWLEDGTFMATYGDGVSDVDLRALLAFHESHGRLATVTAVRPPARFGGIHLEGDEVVRFTEKPQIGEGWINGGFFVFEPGFLRYLTGDEISLEAHALEAAAADGQLMAYRHEGFWQCMDTLRDRRLLEGLWQSGRAAWKTWS